MKAVILAAGRGSRMRDLTDHRPKCLVELHGRPLLDWQLDALRKAGIGEIGIVTGYMSHLLAHRGTRQFHNPRWAATNMVASLACAEAWLADGPCIVSYSDIFYSEAAVRSLMDCEAPLAITYDPHWRELWQRRFANPLDDAETFRLDGQGWLAEIGNKPTSIEQVQGQYMGLLRLTPPGWREMGRVLDDVAPGERDRMHMTGTLQKVVEAGRVRIAAVPYRGEWGEVDSAADLGAYERKESAAARETET